MTLAFAVGATLPLLAFALAGQKLTDRIDAFRRRQRGIRIAGGIVMIAFAVGLVFNLPAVVQRLIPDYTGALQQRVAQSSEIQSQLGTTSTASPSLRPSSSPAFQTGRRSNCDGGGLGRVS